MALNGCHISTTRLTVQVNERIKEVVERIGGVYEPNLSKSTTHLLVGRVGSEKHRMVLERSSKQNIICLLQDWVFECEVSGKEVDVAGYHIPPLKGLIISVTGITDAAELDLFSQVVRMNGAEFSSALSKKKCTHLVVAGEPGGEKYERAKEWGMKICSRSWIDDCISKGSWLPEEDFTVPCRLSGKRVQPEKVVERPKGEDIRRAPKEDRREEMPTVAQDELKILDVFDTAGDATESDLLRADTFFLGGVSNAIRCRCVDMILKGRGRISPFLSYNVTKVLLGNGASLTLRDSVVRLVSLSAADVVTPEGFVSFLKVEGMLSNDDARPHASAKCAKKGAPQSNTMTRPKRKLRVSHRPDAEWVRSPTSMPTNTTTSCGGPREQEAPLESQVVTWK
jgi:hypothetical protein